MSTKSSISDNIRSLLEKDGASIEPKSSTPIKSEGSITAAELVAAFSTTIPPTETVKIRLGTESATVSAAVFANLAQNQANLVIGKVLQSGAILLSSEGRHALLAIQEGTARTKTADELKQEVLSDAYEHRSEGSFFESTEERIEIGSIEQYVSEDAGGKYVTIGRIYISGQGEIYIWFRMGGDNEFFNIGKFDFVTGKVSLISPEESTIFRGLRGFAGKVGGFRLASLAFSRSDDMDAHNITALDQQAAFAKLLNDAGKQVAEFNLAIEIKAAKQDGNNDLAAELTKKKDSVLTPSAVKAVVDAAKAQVTADHQKAADAKITGETEKPNLSSLYGETQKRAHDVLGADIEFVNNDHVVVDRNGNPKAAQHVRTSEGDAVYFKDDGTFTLDVHGAPLGEGVILLNDEGVRVDERGRPFSGASVK